MPRLLIDLIELAVGAGCLVGAALAWRARLRLVSGSLAVAGSAALIHAVIALAGGSR